MVGFSGKERKLGEQALSGITSNLKNTITGVKAIMGKKFHSDDIQQEIGLVGYNMVDVAGKVGIPVKYSDEEIMLTPERAMAMLMKCLQHIAELDQKAPVTDVVLSVPHYFTDAERHSMLAAAQIAGLNCLRLLNDTTAAALSYGIYKTDLPADKPTYVAFVDCGAMDTSVSIVSFVKGKLTVLSTACDRHLGGRDFDMILAQHFAAEWKEKHKINALNDKKAMYRLVTAAEKTKKVLSANPEAPISIECFMNDIDVKGMMQREDMLTVAKPLLDKLDTILAEALEGSGIGKDDIESVEILGGSCRIPAVQDRITSFFAKPVQKTLNFDECIAKGCALQCAMLSPAFKVRDFSVTDITLYPIALSWAGPGGEAGEAPMEVDDEGAEGAAPAAGGDAKATTVFSKFNSVPVTKMITLYRKDTFALSAAYDGSAKLPNGFPTKLAEYSISDIPKPVADAEGKVEPVKVKVKLRLDLHGCLVLESAVAIEEAETVEEVPPEPAPAPPAEPPAEGAEPPAEGAPAAEAPPPAEGAEAAAPPPPEPEKKKSKKVKRIPLSVAAKVASGAISTQELIDAQEAEGNMALQDKLLAETAEAMNALEAAVYKLRDDISTKLGDYLVEADKEKLSALCTTMEDWLYDEGEDCEKAVYVQKLKELNAEFAPSVLRESEAEKRPPAFDELTQAIEKFSAFAASQSDEYEHISTEEKQKVAGECAQAQAWLADTQAKLGALPKTDDPPVKAAEIIAKASSLAGVCTPIMNTPKPLPKLPDPPPAAEAPAEGASAEVPMEEAAPVDGAEAPPAEGEKKPDNMDVD